MSRTVLCTPLRSSGTDAVLVAGVGGAVAPHIRPGDVVVASETRPGMPAAPSFPNSTAELFARLRSALLYCLGGLVPVHVTASRLIDEDVTFALLREAV